MLYKEELIAIGEVAEKHQIYILSDEIYEKLYYGNKADLVSIASLSDRLYDLTIVINGVSKNIFDDRLAHWLRSRK